MSPTRPTEPEPAQAPVNTIPVTGLSIGLGSVGALLLVVVGAVAGWTVKTTNADAQIAQLQGLVAANVVDLKTQREQLTSHALRIQRLEDGAATTGGVMGELKGELKELKTETQRLRSEVLEAIAKLSRTTR